MVILFKGKKVIRSIQRSDELTFEREPGMRIGAFGVNPEKRKPSLF